MIAMSREEVLAEFAAFTPDKLNRYNRETVIVNEELLEQITADDVPVGVVVEIGAWRPDPLYNNKRSVLHMIWNGLLKRDPNGLFWSVIDHNPIAEIWMEAVGLNFYYDLLRKCVLSRCGTIEGLTVHERDYPHLPTAYPLEYSFQVGGENLKEIYNKARHIQSDLEAPAQQLLYDMTRTLARSADRILSSHHAQVSQLVAVVESAESSSDKGSALESLMAALFEQVPGFVVYDRDKRTATEELDLILLNDSRDPVFSRDGPLVLVECKNWTAKPGRPDFSLLESKIRNRHNRCTVAFFISWSGFAETTWRETLRTSRENYVIVCLSGSDVRRAALGGSFPEFLRQATLHTLNR
jgi:hypothetical protein